MPPAARVHPTGYCQQVCEATGLVVTLDFEEPVVVGGLMNAGGGEPGWRDGQVDAYNKSITLTGDEFFYDSSKSENAAWIYVHFDLCNSSSLVWNDIFGKISYIDLQGNSIDSFRIDHNVYEHGLNDDGECGEKESCSSTMRLNGLTTAVCTVVSRNVLKRAYSNDKDSWIHVNTRPAVDAGATNHDRRQGRLDATWRTGELERTARMPLLLPTFPAPPRHDFPGDATAGHPSSYSCPHHAR